MKKNILIVFPHNFFESRSGVHKRVYELVKYLKLRGYEIDLLAAKNFESKWHPDDPFDKKLVDNLFFYDYRAKTPIEKIRETMRRWFDAVNFSGSQINKLIDFTSNELLKKFNSLLKKKKYSHILISYVYYANLIKDNPLAKNSNKMMLIEDFITSQLNDQTKGKIALGDIFEEEIRRINLFDSAICLSNDELNLFSSFATNPKYFYVPMFLKKNDFVERDKFKYDLFFVGFDNFHNINGINWFLKEVYPKLNGKCKMLIVGKVINKIQKENFPDVEFVEFIESLEEVFQNSKLCISPLFTGSGIKIKIVEAMSYGKPVVCTSRSLIGFPQRTNCGCVVADTSEEFSSAIEKLLSDNEFYKEQRKKSCSMFAEYFDQEKVYKDLDKIFC
jgi:glycosyltransferase involved in cell wall biosynthesis